MCDLRALAAIAHTLAAITARQMIDAVQHEAVVLTYVFLWVTWLLQAALSGFLITTDLEPTVSCITGSRSLRSSRGFSPPPEWPARSGCVTGRRRRRRPRHECRLSSG
jgi:hypothetical protein